MEDFGDYVHRRDVPKVVPYPGAPERASAYAHAQKQGPLNGWAPNYPNPRPNTVAERWGMPSIGRGQIQATEHIPTSGASTTTVYNDPTNGVRLYHKNLQTPDYFFTGEAVD